MKFHWFSLKFDLLSIVSFPFLITYKIFGMDGFHVYDG